MYDDSVEKSIDNVEAFLQAFGIRESEVGMVLSPTYGEDEESMGLDYFVKAPGEEYKPTLDASVYSQVSDLEFNNRVYEQWVNAFEERFSEAEIVATDPSQIKVENPAMN